MAGAAGAVFQVNGFRGGRLPSRDEIRQIRFRTNSFSADNHDAGRTQIEIITRPNVSEWNGNASLNYRGDEMNARNAFATTETPEQNRQFNMGLRGPLVKGKTSIRLERRRPPRSAVRHDRRARRERQPPGRRRVPSVGTDQRHGRYRARADQGPDAAPRVPSRRQLHRQPWRRRLQSARARVRPQRAAINQVRAQVQGLLGKTTLQRGAAAVHAAEQRGGVAVERARRSIVLDAFSDGGAGVWNNRSSRGFELADNLDFNVGRKQQMRVGILLEGGATATSTRRTTRGTFTFSDLEAFDAGRPTSFTQRNGQVNTKFNQYQLGVYWQDDIRLNNKFSFSVGVRNEMQSHIDDKLNLMPRLGFTCDAVGQPHGHPRRLRPVLRLVRRTSTTRRCASTACPQRDLLILNPGYPDPLNGTEAQILPRGRIQASPDLSMPQVHQASIGVERQVTQNLSVQATYQMLRGRNQMRSININAPGRSSATRAGPDGRQRHAVRVHRTVRQRSPDVRRQLPIPAAPHLREHELHARAGEESRRQRDVAAREQPRSGRRVGPLAPGRPPSPARDWSTCRWCLACAPT